MNDRKLITSGSPFEKANGYSRAVVVGDEVHIAGTTGYDDLGFLSVLIRRLVTTECADPARIVIAGISDGGDMAAFAACGLPVRFRAVVEYQVEVFFHANLLHSRHSH